MNPSDTGINILDKFSKFDDQWQPRVIASMNDYQFKIARIEGEFIWHDHPDTDEVFIIMKGQLEMQLADRSVMLNEGDLYVVPRGVQHRPVAESECWIMMVEPEGTKNTGDEGGDRTAANDVWV